MIISLWLVWASVSGTGAVHVGSFSSIPACVSAAQQHQHIGNNEFPGYSFICVPAK